MKASGWSPSILVLEEGTHKGEKCGGSDSQYFNFLVLRKGNFISGENKGYAVRVKVICASDLGEIVARNQFERMVT